MSETQAVATAAKDIQGDGRYIPYSGGCMGWFENLGVMKIEKPQNYQYFTALNADLVRAKQVERAGTRVNKRRSPRQELDPEMKVTLKWVNETRAAMCKDLSIHGMRVQIVEESVPLNKDDKVQVQVHDKSGRTLELDLGCTVVRAEKTGKLRTIWNFGIAFPDLTEAQIAKVKELGGLVEE